MQKSKKGFKTKNSELNRVFQRRVLNLFSQIKSGKKKQYSTYKLPIYNDKGELIAFLRPVNQKTLRNENEIALLAKWRQENSFAFPSQFTVTNEGTKGWLENQLLKNPTRILFFIESAGKRQKLIGHLGLYSFEFDANTCEIDNVIRGEKNYLKGVMTFALKTLLKWTYEKLKSKQIFLRVFSDNERAIIFYRRCGFVNYELIPLRKIMKPNLIFWEEDRTLKAADKYFLKMKLG